MENWIFSVSNKRLFKSTLKKIHNYPSGEIITSLSDKNGNNTSVSLKDT